MSKPITAGALAAIQTKTGTEPFYVVKIFWGLGFSYYSTREQGSYLHNIMEVGPIRTQINEDASSSVSSSRIKFSDVDSQMKFIIDNRVAERAPAAIFLAFNGMSAADYIPLLVGRTAGPVEWDDKDRICEFEIETYIDSTDIGFSVTEDDVAGINPEASGVPWPMIFGSCAHVPALHLKRRAECFTQVALRLYQKPVYQIVHDPIADANTIIMVGNPSVYATLGSVEEINTITVDDASLFPQNINISIIIDDVVFRGQFVNQYEFNVTTANAPKYLNLKIGDRDATDPDKDNFSVLWLDSSNIQPIINQHCYFQAPGDLEWYNYCVRQEGAKCWFQAPFTTVIKPYTIIKMDSTHILKETYGVAKCGFVGAVINSFYLFRDALKTRIVTSGENPFGVLMQLMDKTSDDGTSWWTATMDSEVRLWDPQDDDIYIASLIPLNSITAVYGKRRINVNGKTKTIFVPIPSNYYTVHFGSIAGTSATWIKFEPPLLEYDGQNWQEDVYVSGISTVGPNPCDVIRWLILNYTSLFIDTFMFGIAHGHVSGIQANFALFDKRDALRVAKEVAYQSRIGMLLDMGGVGLIYLPVKPTEIIVFDESNIKNLKIKFTETKSIITRRIASYSDNYKDVAHLAKTHELRTKEIERLIRSFFPTETRRRAETKYLTYTNNIDDFGLKTKEEQAYIFSDPSPVALMLEFWGMRGSFVWKYVELTTWLEGTNLQVFDTCIINFTDTSLLGTGGPVSGLIESVDFDPVSKTTTLGICLPIRAGTSTIFEGFWPG